KFTIADVTEQSNLLIGSVDIFRTKAHDIINPSHGWRARATFSGASDILGSPLNFIRSDLEYKRIGSFNAKTRWLLRSRVGALWTDNFEKLPTSLRFFAGGDRSVRGFDFESLGPSDSENNVLGGQYIATLSLETDYMFRPNWRVATFVDIGNAFGRGDESLEHGAGVGLRWVSPIGPVRLDMASALSEPDNPWRLHFSVGPDL
ncbi:MAG: BamA/TamA family outer membrane protein, partial [Gammaproteobacteria bacterium]|nr:BamA/TamA family outer membrane protein [Gammaproteobacteria bacterium]